MNQDLEKLGIWGKMDARIFNSKIMPLVNGNWSAKVLGMELNPNGGPDLVDDSKVIEIKFRLVGKKCGAESYPLSWNVEEHQMEYNEGTDGFWRFADDWLKFLLSLVGLVVLIWLAYYFNKKFEKKKSFLHTLGKRKGKRK